MHSFLGTGAKVANLAQADSRHVSREVLKIALKTGANSSAQCLRVYGKILYSPGTLWV